MREVRKYIILQDRKTIRVFHSDLLDSYWKRANSMCERQMQEIESVIRSATGLQRVFRKHGRSHVDFVISDQNKFRVASTALKIQYESDHEMKSYLVRQI